MRNKPAVNVSEIRAARAAGHSVRAIARDLGVGRGRVTRALARTRTADEFKSAGSLGVRPPVRQQGPYCWSLETIRAARDAQMVGHFKSAVRLAEAMRTDDALFVAYHNRIAPQSAVQTKLVPQDSSRGRTTARKIRDLVHVSRSVLESIHGTLANHGIAIGYIEHGTDDDGTRIEFRITEWPLEHVQWNASREVLETATRSGERVPITHGDGRWIVFRKFLVAPWTQEACVLPGALLWAAHANGIKDWASASTAHGQAKIIGELPEGVALQSGEEGQLSNEAKMFLQMLQDVISGDAAAGIKPAGSGVDFIANGSTAWQVFKELISNREKSAARIYLGTDAILGSVGGAPGVDIATLFGVASTKVQGDFEAIEQGLYSGAYVPCTAINCGDSTYAPRLEYQLPDPDSEQKSAERAAKRDRLMAAIKAYREASMTVDQDVVNALAAEYGVDSPPTLAPTAERSTPLELAPTDVARVVRVREARAAQGLKPLGDERDDLMISELEAEAEANAAPPAPPAPAPAPEPA